MMSATLTVPLGSRPSVDAGSWLQGGIGRLSRLHRIACDAIVGAILVCVASSRDLTVCNVPAQHQPPSAIRPENKGDTLWALKGAGTNFGIVVKVVLKTQKAPTYSVLKCIIPLGDSDKACDKFIKFNEKIAE